MSLPTPERLAAARWFGGKAGAIGRIEECDRLHLGGGAALAILRVDGTDLYVWSEGAAASALLQPGSDPERGLWQFRDAGVTLPAGAEERPIGLDQSNTSYVVGERLVVKLYRRIWPGVHPEVELGRHLTETARLDCVPAFAGSLHWDGHAVALVQEYVPGKDGWAWGAAAVQAGEVADIARLGAESARLHAALASYGSSIATAADLRGWREAAGAQLDAAIAAVPADVAAELRDLRPRILAELDALESPAAPVTLQRLHGDFHIGQVLRAGGGRLVVVDLEGEPTKPVEERSRPGPALRDVAAMLRSFDHLGRYVARDVDPACDVDGWIARAREAFLSAYGPVDAGLLRALEVEKETYEFTYAAAFLPEWMYAPVGGMRWLMEHDG
ncbi:MAG TPA: phosphotransferase [Gaiellales bacterium]|nr:phosphotransferase [Gaiellales bacterium]